MSDIRVETFEPVEIDDALVIVAFHGTGAAAPIAASYLRRQLGLPLIGQVRALPLGPVLHVTDGLATGPIRIYGGETVCQLDGECPRLYLIMAEMPIPIEIARELTDAIMNWAHGARGVLALDALVRGEDDDTPDVYILADGPDSMRHFVGAKATPLPGGVIVGLTASIVANARFYQLAAAALVVEANKGHPDGRAAAALVAAIDPLIPEVVVDPGPLLEEAMEIEEQLRIAMEEAEANQPRRPSHTFI